MLAPQTALTRAKSPEAFRTISEVAMELDVPQHVLRFWELRFSQVKPIKRAGARRYYRPEDVDLLRGIRALLYSDGFTIKGVQKILRDKGLRHVAELGRACRGQCMDDQDLRNAAVDFDERGEVVIASPTIERAQAIEATVTLWEQQTKASFGPLEPEKPRLAVADRERLEMLLGELLELKVRFRALRAS